MMTIPSPELHRDDRTRRILIAWVLPLAIYAALAALITWPLVTQIGTHAAGAGYADADEIIRHGWWIKEAVLHGENPFRQTLLAYPDGFTSTLMWAYPLRFGPTALLAFAVAPLAAYNLVVLITLTINGFAAYRLGLDLSGRPLAALLGGLVFLAFPAMQGHASAGHVEILTLWPLALTALCLWRILRGGAGWRTVIGGAVCFALAALGMVSQIIYGLMPLVGVFGLYFLLFARDRIVVRGAVLHDQPWARAAAMIVLGGVLLLPFFGPLLTEAGRAEVEGLSEPGRVAYSTDLLAFISPSPFGFFEDAAPAYTRDVLGTNSAEGSAYLGIAAVALAAVALAARKESRPWLALGLVAMILSLGPLLKWRDQPVTLRFEDFETAITLPWAFVQNLPVIDATRTPGRFNLVTGLALSALVSLGAGVLLGRVRRVPLRIALVGAVGAVIVLEYQLFWPFLTVDARLPAYFDQLAAEDDVRAVADVPLDNPLVQKAALYEQIAHGKPIIAGHISRRTPQNPAVLRLIDAAALGDEADPLTTLRREDVAYVLSAAGVDRLVVHKPFLADAAATLDRLRSIFGGATYEDDGIAVFAVPRVPDPPEGFTLAVTEGADGWSAAVPVGDFSGRWLAEDGDLSLVAGSAQAGDLVFPAASYGAAGPVGVWLDGDLIDAVTVEEGAVRVPLWLDAGFHTLRLRALDGCTSYAFDLACLNETALAPSCAPLDTPVCISAAFGAPTWEPDGAQPVALDAAVGDGLTLRAYTLDQDADALHLRLYWAASEPLDEHYALFVHVADPATGAPLAQYTGFPALPTDSWAAGTRWQSDVTVDLREVPDGTAAINVGWFVPETGARLGLVQVATVEIGDVGG
ncbi:hypothetical protein [Aggregatilinea lenta]|uniref:hypothetical protein n=1 Tax=Aggregatilinea lenta TaxID=913108 RepID=UPI000E5B8C47|nr:hypothetical protein [Aggregatilinea lenta]